MSPGALATLTGATTAAGWDALEPLARGRRTAVSLVQVDGRPCVIKRYTDRRAFLLRTFLRKSRAARETRALQSVAAAWPENPVRALAWGERRVLGFVPECWIVTTEFRDAFDLRQLKHLDPEALAATQAALLAALPAALAQLHRGGLFARTLRGKNILFQPGSGRVALIDLPYARGGARVGLKERAFDLASLWTELRRSYDAPAWRAFLDAYLAAAAPDLEDPAAARAALDPEALQQISLRLRHRTPLTSWIGRWKRWFRHTRLGEALTGFDEVPRD
ncbi:MAG: lipopolysaccharide kinase InaA family protein [Planctomycetota bacterium]